MVNLQAPPLMLPYFFKCRFELVRFTITTFMLRQVVKSKTLRACCEANLKHESRALVACYTCVFTWAPAPQRDLVVM